MLGLLAVRQLSSIPSDAKDENSVLGAEAEWKSNRRKEDEGALLSVHGKPETDSLGSDPRPKHGKKVYHPLPHEANLAHELHQTVRGHA